MRIHHHTQNQSTEQNAKELKSRIMEFLAKINKEDTIQTKMMNDQRLKTFYVSREIACPFFWNIARKSAVYPKVFRFCWQFRFFSVFVDNFFSFRIENTISFNSIFLVTIYEIKNISTYSILLNLNSPNIRKLRVFTSLNQTN